MLTNTSGSIREAIHEHGFAIVNDIYDDEQVNGLLHGIEEKDRGKDTFRKGTELFAIRQFLREVPETASIIFSPQLLSMLREAAGDGYFAVKSIYFDKPAQSNWFVSFHQDLTISVDKKTTDPGFTGWTLKQNQYAEQPPVALLEDNITLRIHLDDTTEDNGALYVIPGSHQKGIIRITDSEFSGKTACPVKRGGVMLMKPLLLHASSRTLNGARRRVIHIECSRQSLPAGIQWAEYSPLSFTDTNGNG